MKGSSRKSVVTKAPMYTHAETDAAVVKNALVHKDTFAVLVNRYEQPLRRYLRRLGVRLPQDQEDILQDIFIKVYRNLHAFDQSLSFSSWIYRIAHNEAMSWFRKRKVRPEHTVVGESEAVLSLIADESDGADISALARERETTLQSALSLLDEKYKTILILRFFEEKTYEEIGDILKIPVGTVATLVHRAKQKLREIIHTQQAHYGHTT